MMHPYSHILKAVAEGKTVQVLEANVDPDTPSVWTDITAEDVLAIVTAETYAPEDMRVKPETVIVNGYTVLSPVREALSWGTEYYPASRSKKAVKYLWVGSVMDHNFLDMGVVFLSKEDAAASKLKPFSILDKSLIERNKYENPTESKGVYSLYPLAFTTIMHSCLRITECRKYGR